MNELRKQFEALSRVTEILNEYGDAIVFNEDSNKYETPCYSTFIPEYVYELNFGWYAFQEQQKQLDEKQKYIDHLHSLMDDAASLIREGNDSDALELLK